jgi:hypothetical protein
MARGRVATPVSEEQRRKAIEILTPVKTSGSPLGDALDKIVSEVKIPATQARKIADDFGVIQHRTRKATTYEEIGDRVITITIRKGAATVWDDTHTEELKTYLTRKVRDTDEIVESPKPGGGWTIQPSGLLTSITKEAEADLDRTLTLLKKAQAELEAKKAARKANAPAAS